MSVLTVARSLLILGAACGAVSDSSATFKLQTTYDSSNFFDSFNFRSAAYYNSIGIDSDPTNGSVNYLSRADAIAAGIVNTKNNQVYLGVDFTHKAKLRGSSKTIHGRDSIRLEAKQQWNRGIMIADIQHMPGTACGVWPSLWSYNFAENPVGEIDIIEGINVQDSNVVSLHTCGTCSFTGIGGQNPRPNCNVGGTVSKSCADGTQYDGCGNTMSQGSYGPAFNDGGGGVFATWLDTDAIQIYWWPRNKVPQDIVDGSLKPGRWGPPASYFQNGKGCNVGKYYKGQTIIANIDFCGSNIDQDTWNAQCQASTGTTTCDAYVANNPQAFKDSYWLFNSIKIYQQTS